MEQYIIKGGNPLVGEVEIGGAKNAALAILAAAIMTDETVLIENLPDVNDINVMLRRSARSGQWCKGLTDILSRSMEERSVISISSMITSRRSGLPITCLALCSANINMRKWRSREDAISEADRSTSI